MRLVAHHPLADDLPGIVDVVRGEQVPPASLRNELVEVRHLPRAVIVEVGRSVDQFWPGSGNAVFSWVQAKPTTCPRLLTALDVLLSWPGSVPRSCVRLYPSVVEERSPFELGALQFPTIPDHRRAARGH